MRRSIAGLALVVFVAGAPGLATGGWKRETPRDIDVAVPPGSPLEWDKDLNQPVPTGGRARVPTTDKLPETAKDPAKVPAGGGTVASRPPEPLNYGTTNLYDYFGITTRDIMNHITVTVPAGGLTHKGDVSSGGGTSNVTWIFPPGHTVELVWVGTASCLRAILHPEIVSVPEIVAYLCEVGEPSIVGAKNIGGPVGERIKKLITPIDENKMPSLKPGATAYETMVIRLSVVEISSGFPHSLDPTYSRRTLALGDDAYKAVVECTKNDHLLVRRNAVAVLANFRNADAVDQLRKIFAATTDPVMKYRALQGLLKKRDAGSVPALLAGLKSPDEVYRNACAYALGAIGDKRALAPLSDAARTTDDRDFLWSLLPAIARLSEKKEHADFLAAMEKRVATLPPQKGRGEPINPDVNKGFPVAPPTPEPADTKLKVLAEMCRLGRAAAQDDAAMKELHDRLDKDGLKAYYVPTWYLAIECLAKTGNPAIPRLKKIIADVKEAAVAQAALQALLSFTPEGEYLKQLAIGGGHAPVRALAILALADRDEKTLKEVCNQVIDGYSGGDSGGAFVVGTACQVLGKVGGHDFDRLVKLVEKALAAKAWAAREGDDDPDITKSKIAIHPPLLEIAVIELGRTGNVKAIPTLLSVLKSAAKGGRGEAALGLGALGGRESTDALLVSIDDEKDGWVRFCSYQALKKLSGQDHFCDWLFAGPDARKKYSAKYRAWAGGGK